MQIAEDLVADYRLAMMRRPWDDREGLERRGQAAERLANKAFRLNNRAAWEVVQVIEYRLQTESCLRPTDPGDVLVLQTLYSVEESTIAPTTLPTGLSPKQFCDHLETEMAKYSSVDCEVINMMAAGKFDASDWRYLAYQWLAPTTNFTRMIALASLPLPGHLARHMYHNLFDEVGRGELEKTHQILLGRFLRHFDVEQNNPEALLAWTEPNMLAMVNAQLRMLWHPEAAWGLGSMFLFEKLVPSELDKIRTGLLALGVPRDTLAWFDEHVVVDVVHAEDWLGVVEAHLTDYQSQSLAFAAAVERGRWAQRSWQGMLEGWQTWKKTGVAPHVPAAELRKLTGV